MSNREDRLICIGVLADAHGVQGNFKVKSFTEVPADIASYGPVSTKSGDRHLSLELQREIKPAIFLTSAPEIESREDVLSLKGEKLYVRRSALPPPEEDEFYFEDLTGLRAETADGTPYGSVKAVLNHGAGDLLELMNVPGEKGVKIIPFQKKVVTSIDFETGTMVIQIPDELK